MAKIRLINHIPHIFCPACLRPHGIDTRWKYNYKPNAPTFTPQVIFRLKGTVRATGERIQISCIFIVTDGKIRFLKDSTHDKVNELMDLPDWNDVEMEEEKRRIGIAKAEENIP